MGTGGAVNKGAAEAILRNAGLKLRPIKADGQLLFPIWKDGDSVHAESVKADKEKSVLQQSPKFMLDDRRTAVGRVFNFVMLALLVINLVVGYNTIQDSDGLCFLLPFIFIEIVLGAILYGESLYTLPTRIQAAFSSLTSRKKALDAMIEFMARERLKMLSFFLAATTLFLAYLYATKGNASERQ